MFIFITQNFSFFISSFTLSFERKLCFNIKMILKVSKNLNICSVYVATENAME